uniref:Cadherin domain-containing protein n=1 Tax=Meleagris gallopavo TaxID=9103 RepID=A0A803YS52_MELGA
MDAYDSVDDGDVYFEVDRWTGDLFLSKELDYETSSHFFLQVIIKDYSNNPPQNNTVFLSIDVEDLNDHSPHFQDDFIVIGIEENVPIGTLVYTFNAKDGDGSSPNNQAINVADRRRDSLTAKIVILDVNDNSPNVGLLVHHVTAKDPDEGRNGHVMYQLISGNENGSFILDKITGTVTLFTAQLLDREVQEHYSLTVMALDGGTPALSAMQVLTILVLDVNDESPIFLQQLYETAVYENQDPGELILFPNAVVCHNFIFLCLKGGNVGEYFTLNNTSGKLLVTRILDREDVSNFTLVIECHDLGSPPRSSTALLYITVLDENDHSPLFEKNQYHISVREDVEEGTAILDLFASDRDDGPNGKVTYSLIGDTFGAFAINSVTGSIQSQDLCFRRAKFRLLKELLNGIPWETVLKGMGTEQSWQLFKSTLLRAQRLPIPQQKKLSRGGRRPTWLCKDLQLKLREKREMYRKWKQGCAAWEYRAVVCVCRDRIRKVKAAELGEGCGK